MPCATVLLAPARLAAVGLLALAPAAQAAGGRGKERSPKPDKLPIATVGSYSEERSREAFAAIDRSADDRIDIFEFTHAQDEGSAGSVQDPAAFRSADEDRSGFLDWPEFDRRMRAMLRLRGEFRYRPARVLPPHPAPAPGAAKPSRKGGGANDARTKAVLAMLDTDHTGGVSRQEFEVLLQSAGLPAVLIAKFTAADADGDGQLDDRELSHVLSLLSEASSSTPATGAAPGLAPAWRRADADGDGEVSVAELDSALREHDLLLGRWAAKIVADADRSGDQRLGPAEVLAAEPRKEAAAGK